MASEPGDMYFSIGRQSKKAGYDYVRKHLIRHLRTDPQYYRASGGHAVRV